MIQSCLPLQCFLPLSNPSPRHPFFFSAPHFRKSLSLSYRLFQSFLSSLFTLSSDPILSCLTTVCASHLSYHFLLSPSCRARLHYRGVKYRSSVTFVGISCRRKSLQQLYETRRALHKIQRKRIHGNWDDQRNSSTRRSVESDKRCLRCRPDFNPGECSCGKPSVNYFFLKLRKVGLLPEPNQIVLSLLTIWICGGLRVHLVPWAWQRSTDI